MHNAGMLHDAPMLLVYIDDTYPVLHVIIEQYKYKPTTTGNRQYQVHRHFRFVCQSDYFRRALQGLFYGSIQIYIGSTSRGRGRRHGPPLRECIHAHNIYIDVHTCANYRTYRNCSLLQNVNQNGSTTTVHSAIAMVRTAVR
jgi:hypothetical protein